MTARIPPSVELTMRATTAGALGQEPARPAAAGLGWLSRSRWLEPIGLAGVLLVAAVLDFFDLSRAGFANAYYAAAVRSMASSWHNFLFSAYDPGGFVSIDKPPAGFWLQVLSVKLFGFHGVSLLLPEALAGVLSVAVVFYLVRRRFGAVAGLLAALALAITPISVATNRNNTIDSLLALTLLLAAWAATLAVERGRLRWLLLCLALVGVGFNIKMAEAFVALPAFVLVYLLAAPLSWRKRILHLALGGMVLAVVALSWVTAVDLVPASQRPYVGSSQHNSALELALGYNGINRLFPRRFFRGSRPAPPARPAASTAPRAGQSAPPDTPVTRFVAPPGFGGPVNGWATPLRLFSPQFAGQLSWLIPLAAFGLVAAAWQMRLWRRLDDRQRSVLLWGAWFLSGFLLFTFDQASRPYYMVTLAPAIAALAGLGVVALWHDYRRHALRGWLLPLALAATAAVQVLILRPYPSWSGWLTPLVAGLAGLAAAVLVVARLMPRHGRLAPLALGAAALGALGLFVAPAVWSGVTVTRAAPGGIPSAGPALAGFGFFAGRVPANRAAPARPEAGLGVDAKLLGYLEANRGQSRFLVATLNAQTASPIILQTGQPVMALGGFMGADPILTPQSLARDVQDGVVRFFLLPDMTAATAPQPELSSVAPRGQQAPSAAGGAGFQSTGSERAAGGERPASGGVEGAPPQPSAPFLGAFTGFFGRGSAVQSWVTAHCTPVPAQEWRSAGTAPSSGRSSFGFGGSQQLYDCAGA